MPDCERWFGIIRADWIDKNIRLDLIGASDYVRAPVSLRALPPAYGIAAGGGRANEEAAMQWTTPKIVEIACGCEINAYFPAAL